jgi:hypothetical protein
MDTDTTGATAPRPGQLTAPSPTEAGPCPRVTGTQPPRRWPHPAVVHLLVLAGYLIAGILATWPRVTQLGSGTVPDTTDTAQYVWNFWWLAHCVTHLQNPWLSTYMGAPFGVQLGFNTLMPLPCLLLVPVTLAFGPAASFTLMTIALPGLCCYAMYRLARVWGCGGGREGTSQIAAVAAGALFGLATMLVWQDEFHLTFAAAVLFLPLTLEACVRLRRSPGRRQAIILGATVGSVFLVNQETAIFPLIVTALAVVPWLLRQPRLSKFGFTALAGVVAAVIAAPQVIAMGQQVAAGGARVAADTMAAWDGAFGVPAQTLFSPSPQAASYGLRDVATTYQFSQGSEGRPTFGLILTLLALLGLIVAWRRGSARLLALLWLGSAVLALGTVLVIGNRTFVPFAQMWHGIRVSELMPYTWFVRIPGLSSFREADRLALLGLMPAALLAGAAVDWLAVRHRAVLTVLLTLAVLEAGWFGTRGLTTPAAMPALDRPIAADHSDSIVVDVPFGLRGGFPLYGSSMVPGSLLLATQDGHPRAISYTSWVPATTTSADKHHPFYLGLVNLQDNRPVLAGQLAAARADAAAMHVGWVLVWRWPTGLASYLSSTGFRFDYRADHVAVYRAVPTG